jgi:hypothetical protein
MPTTKNSIRETSIRDLALRPPGVREIKLALEPDMPFDRVVEVLKDALTLRLPKGCAPCLSGLDRLVVNNVIFEAINERAAMQQNETIRL